MYDPQVVDALLELQQQGSTERAIADDVPGRAEAEARAALQKTTDEHLQTKWRLKARGQVVQEAPRFEMIQDTINHWAHHRGQMTVYLRLMGAKVQAIYGPSADEQAFH